MSDSVSGRNNLVHLNDISFLDRETQEPEQRPGSQVSGESLVNQQRQSSAEAKVAREEFEPYEDDMAALAAQGGKNIKNKTERDFFRRIFGGGSGNKYSPANIKNRAPHLLELQQRANACDAAFIKTCCKESQNSNWLSVMYAKAQTSEQRAFLDLQLCDQIAGKLFAVTKDNDLYQAVKAQLGELMAAGDAQSLKNAQDELSHVVNMYSRDGLTSEQQQALKQLQQSADLIGTQKSTFLNELDANFAKMHQVLADPQGVDLSHDPRVTFSCDTKPGAQGIPAGAGIGAIRESSSVKDKLEIVRVGNEQATKQLELYNQIKTELNNKSLQDSSASILLEQAKSAGSGNQSIIALIQKHSSETANQLLAQLKSAVQSLQPAGIASQLQKAAEGILHDLLPADQQRVIEQLCAEFAGLKLPDDAPGTLKTLRDFLAPLPGTRPDLMGQLPRLLGLLGRTDFNLKPLEPLAGAGGMEQFFKDFMQACNTPQDRVAFMDRIADAGLANPQAGAATLNLLDELSSLDRQSAHRNEYYFNLCQVKQYLSDIPDLMNNLGKALSDVNGEQLEQYAVAVRTVGKILTQQPSQITAQDLTALINLSLDERLSPIDRIFMPLLHAGYQRSVLESGAQNAPLQLFNAQGREGAAHSPAAAQNAVMAGGLGHVTAFRSQLSEQVLQHLAGTSSGMVRTHSQGNLVDTLSDKLNQAFGTRLDRTAMENTTQAGKVNLALNQMRNEALIINEKVLSKERYQTLNADELLAECKGSKAHRDKIITLNKRYAGVSKEFLDKHFKDQSIIHNPLFLKAFEANVKAPHNEGKPDGRLLDNMSKTAASISMLRDNLVDDLYLYNTQNLAQLGVDYPEELRLSESDLQLASQINAFSIKQQYVDANIGAPLEITAEEKAQFGPDSAQVKALNDKLDRALEALEKNIAKLSAQTPLSKVGELLVRKYGQLYMAKFGADLALLRFQGEGTKLLTDNEAFNDPEKYVPKKDAQGQDIPYDTFVKNLSNQAARQVFESALTQMPNLNAMSRGHFGGALDNSFYADIVLDSLLTDISASDSTLKEQLTASLTTEPLSVADKQALTKAMFSTLAAADPDTLDIYAKNHSEEENTFAAGLTGIMEAGSEVSEEQFNALIETFFNEELTPIRQQTADAMLAAQPIFGPTARETIDLSGLTGPGSSEALKGAAKTFMRGLNAVNDTNTKESVAYNSHASELYNIANDLLKSDSNVRADLRFAGAYAASQLKLSGSDELLQRFPSMSKEQRAEARALMAKALVSRGYDESLATVLGAAKLNEQGNDLGFKKTWQSLKEHFFNLRSDIITNSNPSTMLAEQKLNLARTVPVVREMLGRIDREHIQLSDHTKDVKVDVAKLAKLTGVPIDELPVKLTLSLELFKKSGVVFSRDESGKLHLHANLAKLGIKVSVSASDRVLDGMKAQASGSASFANVADLKFNSDEDAINFVSRMLNGMLTPMDIKTATAAATGSSNTQEGEVTASLDLGQTVFKAINYKDLSTIDTTSNKDEKKKLQTVFDGSHPEALKLLDNITFGSASVGMKFTRHSEQIEDVTGITKRVDKSYGVSGKAVPVQLKVGTKKLVDAKSAMLKNTDIVNFVREEVKVLSANTSEKGLNFAKNVEQMQKDYDNFLTCLLP